MKYYYLKRHKGIFKYFQNGKTKYGYRFTYYSSNRKRHEKSKRGFTNVDEAIRARSNISSLKSQSNNSNLTFKTWCNHYISMIKPPIRKITTYKSYKNLLNRYIIPVIGNIKLKDLTLDTYQNQCINKLLKQGLSRRTVIVVNARVQTVMNYAVKTRHLRMNQLKLITIPKVNIRPMHVIMSKHQMKMFNNNLKHHSLQYQVIYFTLEFTGMRAGELLGLQVKDIDTKHHIISINHTRDSYSLRAPKTTHSKRKLMIPSRLNNLLVQYISHCHSKFNTTGNSLLILGKHGKPLTPRDIPAILKKLLIECGLNKLVGKFVPHSFRHTLASRLINKGVSIITVSKILGHKNSSITLSIYANSVPNSIPNIAKYLN